MTQTPDIEYPWLDQLGRFVVWTVCVGPNDENDCTNYFPHEHEDLVANWGSAVAGFGEESTWLYGKRITPRLIERYVDPNWDPDDYDPDNESTWPQIFERVVNTWTVGIEISTEQRDQIHPAIELYNGDPGTVSVSGIIDETYYVYPVVFQDAQFCYLPRCSSSGKNFTGEHCLGGGGWFPLEPYDPDCDPPIYPMDSITRFIPSAQTEEDILYNLVWSYYINEEGDDEFQVPKTASLKANMKVYAPSTDWMALMNSLMKLTYFYNGIYH